MRTSTLLARNLAWFWRTNLAVVLGVATATAVLAGALMVGDSVRGSLRDLVLARLGNVESVIAGAGFFRDQLASDVGRACPIIAITGVATHESSRHRAAGIQVFGVDDRFWKFQGEAGDPPNGREVLLSAALARELGSHAGDSILIRVQKPSAIPLESMHGRKDDVGQTIRLTMRGIAPHDFSFRPEQGDVRAVYVPLSRLQRDLSVPGKVNTVLVGHLPNLGEVLKQRYQLADLGLRVRRLEPPDCWSVESESGVISDDLEKVVMDAATSVGSQVQPVLSYLANSMRVGNRVIPYSLVTAMVEPPAPDEKDGITLNTWAAHDLDAKLGDQLTTEYYLWKSDGRLHTATAEFRVARIEPIEGTAADRNLTPDYPGITDTDSLHDWDPPFPLDLSRIRPADEDYWKQYRTTPKAFIPLARGRELWGTRFGSLTSIRVLPATEGFEDKLHDAIDPQKFGLVTLPVRVQGLEAAHGATDFSEYFIYFSFFLMVSALLLTGLFFKLGVEQRLREIGTLRALGFPAAKIRSIFLLEGSILSAVGAVLGLAAAIGYCALILYGLRTWWVDAVGTRLITLHVSILSLGYGAVAGAATALGAITWTLRRLQSTTARGLVAGDSKVRRNRWRIPLSILAVFAAGGMLALAWEGKLDMTGGFFGAGTLLLIAALLAVAAWLHARGHAALDSPVMLGVRSVAYRPGRTILSIALIASAIFVIVSLDAFQQQGSTRDFEGYPLMAESVLPLIHNPATPEGRDALNIPKLDGVEIVAFRLRPGDDASCLNLYQPRNPAILAPPESFLRWPELFVGLRGGAIPAIADANSMEYVLHLKMGDQLSVDHTRLQMVRAISDSIFQSQLLISETNFLHHFAESEGFRFFLLKAPPEAIPVLEDALSDYGFEIQSVSARLASFHRVENTYLATFRALGGLGLVLGTIGLAVIILRNVLERRKELALLRAVGYRPEHLGRMVLAENLVLLLAGLLIGTACAMLAVAPAVSSRGGHLPILSLAVLLGAVIVTGVASSLIATSAALRSPLLPALRSE
jgi:ABC-type antimicrobial peptide transport system permease subunit